MKVFLLISLLFLGLKMFAQNDKYFDRSLNSIETEIQINGSLLKSHNKSSTSRTAKIIKSFPTPGGGGGDITFDGTNLWVAAWGKQTIYKMSPIDGSILKSIPTSNLIPYGLEFDGNNLWIADNFYRHFQKIDTVDGTILQSFDKPKLKPGGLAWDGNYLWNNSLTGNCVTERDSVFQLNTVGVILQRHLALSNCVSSLTFDGKYLWTGDNSSNEIYKIDIPSWSIIDTITFIGCTLPNGLTFDGKYLWVENQFTDSTYKRYDTIYQLDIGFESYGISDIATDSKQVKVYPNPSSSIINFEPNFDPFEKSLTLIIYNLTGQMILKKVFIKPDQMILNLANYKSGIYFYTISDKELFFNSGKIIKE
jgi:hypothetical protein